MPETERNEKEGEGTPDRKQETGAPGPQVGADNFGKRGLKGPEVSEAAGVTPEVTKDANGKVEEALDKAKREKEYRDMVGKFDFAENEPSDFDKGVIDQTNGNEQLGTEKKRQEANTVLLSTIEKEIQEETDPSKKQKLTQKMDQLKAEQAILGAFADWLKRALARANEPGNNSISGNGLTFDVNSVNDPELGQMLKRAMGEVGTTEKNYGANKYLGGANSQAIPWCAAFVNWVLGESGYKGTHSNLAKSFINGSGSGHVGFKVNNQVLGGNQSDQVSLVNTAPDKMVAGWVMPKDVGKAKQGPCKFSDVPQGAIVVFDRNGGDTKVS